MDFFGAVAPAAVVMTSQGTPHGRFQRAIERGQLFQAELAARELGWLNLGDALELTVLIAQNDPARYGRAAVRWHGRLALETSGLELADSQLALAALASLPTDAEGATAALVTLDELERRARAGGAKVHRSCISRPFDRHGLGGET
jgi:hypothetical protein